MAPVSAVHDSPVSVREKGGRLVLVFNVANVKSGSVHIEHRCESEEEPAGSIHISFGSVSPNKQFEKHLVLPHCVEAGKTVKDVQSKSLTVQLVKVDPAVEWGQAWLKPGKSGKNSGKKGAPTSPSSGPSRSPASVPASPAAHAESPPAIALSQAESPPLMELDGMDDDLDDLIARERDKEKDELHHKEQLEKEQQEPKHDTSQEKGGKERKAQQAKGKENQELVKKEQTPIEPKTSERKHKEQQKEEKSRKEPQKGVEQARHEEDKEEQRRKDKGKQSQEQHHDQALDGLDGLDDSQPAGGKKNRRGKSKAQKKKAESAHDDSNAVAKDSSKADPDKSKSAEVPVASPKTATKNSRSAKRNAQEKEKEETKEDKGFPLLPPSDPEIMQLMSDGQSAFQTDPKKATVLLRLAGRKGYLPAYLLLGQLASARKDDTLMIESLCSLLVAPKVEQQLPKDLLSNCAMQLAAVLRDPKNKSAAGAHAQDIKSIAKSWPIMQTVATQADSVEGIRRAVAEKQEELMRLSQTSQNIQSSQAEQHSEFDRIKSALSQKEAGKNVPEKSEFDRIKAALSQNTMENKVPEQSEFDRIKAAMNPKAPASGDALKGTWHDEGSSWRFEVQVPGLKSLSEGKLDISKNVIRLQGSDGSNLVLASTPEMFDVAAAQATWSRKLSRLEVISPKRVKACAPPKPAAMPSEETFALMD